MESGGIRSLRHDPSKAAWPLALAVRSQGNGPNRAGHILAFPLIRVFRFSARKELQRKVRSFTRVRWR